MDTSLLTFLNQSMAHPVLDALMLAITLIGTPVYHLLALGPALLVRRWRRWVIPLALTYAITFGVTMFFQTLVERPRPDVMLVRLIWPQPAFYSYPSGHTSAAFALAALLGLMTRRPGVWAAGLTWAVLIAASRVYLGHHYPSDVLAGALLGACCGASCYGVYCRRNIGWLVWLQTATAVMATHMAYLGILPWRYLSWPYADKVMHALLLGSIGLWLNLALNNRSVLIGAWRVPVAIALPFGAALIEECIQATSPLRSFDAFDLACDLLGLLVAWWMTRPRMVAARVKG